MPEHPACTKTPNPLDEFGVISRFFTDRSFYPSAWPSQGAGDDCAFLDVGPMRLAVTADMMALGSHFLENADPYTVGRKALAVNLSDLAAAGSEPKAFFSLFLCLASTSVGWMVFPKVFWKRRAVLIVRFAAEILSNPLQNRDSPLTPRFPSLRWANCLPAKD